MRKILSTALAFFLILSTVLTISAADDISLTVNGVQLKTDVAPQIIDGTLMLPVRAVFEALGATVEWEAATRTATSTIGDYAVKCTIDSKILTVCGEETAMDKPPVIVGGRTLMSAEFAAAAFGCDIDVSEDMKSIYIINAPDVAGVFTILVSGNYTANDFDASYEESEFVARSIEARNSMIKQEYGVEVRTYDITQFGSVTGSGKGFTAIYNDFLAGEKTYDAASIGAYDVAALSCNGILYDLKNVQYIDLTKDYWDKNAEKDLAANGKLYYTSGDIGIANDKVTHVVYFNKSVVDEDLYALVKEDAWTLEKFSELVKKIGEDVDANGVYNEKDKYGLLVWNDPMVAVLSGADERIARVNESGKAEITLHNERTVNLYENFTQLAFDQYHVYNYQYDNTAGMSTPTSTWNENRDNMFLENRAAFYMNTLSVVDRYSDKDIDFGILPYPKLDSEQVNYGHYVSPYHSQFVCVPATADSARSGFVLDYLAQKGNETLGKAYYDILLTRKNGYDTDSIAMLDIIFASQVYDIGAIYKVGDFPTKLGNMFVTRSSLTDIYEAGRDVAESRIDIINEAFQ